VFNLSTNDDVDCDAVYSLNEDVCNLAVIPFVNAVFNDDCELENDWVNEFNALISTDVDTNPKSLICVEELIVPIGIDVEELINPNAVICADELTTLLPLVSNEDVTDSKDTNLSLSNILTLEVTASARVSNSIL
jgi:hypothetical protein